MIINLPASLKSQLNRIYYHWTAGNYTQIFDSYHINIIYDGKCARAIQTKPLNQTGAHTYRRNTGAIGITFCAMAGATSNVFGNFPVRNEQIEVAAKVGAELSLLLDIPIANIKDHAWAAKQDKYYPDRWDIEPYWDIVLNKLKWYRSKLKTGAIAYEHYW